MWNNSKASWTLVDIDISPNFLKSDKKWHCENFLVKQSQTKTVFTDIVYCFCQTGKDYFYNH